MRKQRTGMRAWSREIVQNGRAGGQLATFSGDQALLANEARMLSILPHDAGRAGALFLCFGPSRRARRGERCEASPRSPLCV